MTTPTLGTKGAALDLLVRQGATLGPNSTLLKDGTGAAMDLTGCTLSAQIRRSPSSSTVDATATFTITNAVLGAFDWEFPATETAMLSCDAVDETLPESQYVWDMELLYASGRVVPLLYGAVSVFREVTKA
jgi:hypothetical protein